MRTGNAGLPPVTSQMRIAASRTSRAEALSQHGQVRVRLARHQNRGPVRLQLVGERTGLDPAVPGERDLYYPLAHDLCVFHGVAIGHMHFQGAARAAWWA